ncbi:MAG TPA: DUF3006 domain-containing protein [Blastocatellia bacterium]|jgi:hypothetical protein|nr:DUF3006 domain-containing protein [Blastocatellia bacterium]
MSNSNEPIKAFIDRIESGLAVILLSDDSGVQFDLPLEYLPPGTEAGDHLVITFQLDPESREETLRSVTELKRRLTEGSDPQQTKFKL